MNSYYLEEARAKVEIRRKFREGPWGYRKFELLELDLKLTNYRSKYKSHIGDNNTLLCSITGLLGIFSYGLGFPKNLTSLLIGGTITFIGKSIFDYKRYQTSYDRKEEIMDTLREIVYSKPIDLKIMQKRIDTLLIDYDEW